MGLLFNTGGSMRISIIMILLLVSSWGFARDFYSIKDKSIEGKEISMNDFKGKVLLIVNIASQCGYTPQLEKLEVLYKKYQKKNFVVLGVPTNDFGGQTPEDDQAMKEFCQKNYQVSFPLLKKATVKGKEKRELYKFLTEETPKRFQAEVGWNFEKFLIDRKGQVRGRFRSSMGPLDPSLLKEIESLL